MMEESPSSCQTPPPIPRPAMPGSTPSPSPLPKNDSKVDKTAREEPLPLTTSEGQRPAKGNPPLDKESKEKLVKDVSAAKDAVKFLKQGFPKETTGKKGAGEVSTGRGRAKGRGKGGRGCGKGSKKEEEAEELPETDMGFGDEDEDEIVDLVEELDAASDASVDAPTERLSPRAPPQPKAAARVKAAARAKANSKAAAAPKTKTTPKAKTAPKAAPKKKSSEKAKAKAKSKASTERKSTQKRATSSDEAQFLNFHQHLVFQKGCRRFLVPWSCLVVAHQGRVPTGDHSLRNAYHKHLKDTMASLNKDGIRGRAALKEARSTPLIEQHVFAWVVPLKEQLFFHVPHDQGHFFEASRSSSPFEVPPMIFCQPNQNLFRHIFGLSKRDMIVNKNRGGTTTQFAWLQCRR